ncbi:fimbria/pilus outer membrane usher protein [Limnobaculum xujianqingii]|uniref:fimbria/pilus outer membrane usher protein n=1 Tax=Limnobaculum xujianqingii TaxID=2738837 RepID=UPI0015E80223|nr:fimbria/pilus outer membrane usher protein [Limnobaculum xujianqingii]
MMINAAREFDAGVFLRDALLNKVLLPLNILLFSLPLMAVQPTLSESTVNSSVSERPDAPPRPVSDTDELPEMSLMLEIVINGRQTQDITPVSYRSGHYYITSEAFNRLGLPLKITDSPEVEIDTLKDVQASYESNTQQLLITVPSNWLPEQQIKDYKTQSFEQAESTLGLLFNYDIYASHNSGDTESNAVSAYTEQRLLGAIGVLSNNGIYNQNLNSDTNNNTDSRYLRYDTKWYYNDEKRMLKYSIGDIITDALSWSTSIRLGGLQIGRNFSTRPDLITYPLPQFAGQAAVPSAVDVYIDSYKYSSSNVNPGPFTIETVPYINGAGNANVVVTDPLGRQVNTSVSFYVSSELLQQGLSDFSLSAGKIRNNYGLKNFDYDNNAASTTLRYGLTNWMTLEGRAEGASQLNVEGIGANLKLGSFGILSGSYSQSHAQKDAFKAANAPTLSPDITPSDNHSLNGNQSSVGYSYTQRYFGINAQRVIRSGGYGDLSSYKSTYRLDKQVDQITANTSFDQYGSIGIGYFDVHQSDNHRFRLLNLSYSVPLFKNSSLYASVNREIGASGYSAQVIISIPLGDWGGASVSSSRDENNNWTHQANYNRAAPTDGGLGWNLSYAKNPSGQTDYKQASLDLSARKMRLQGGIYGSDQQTYWGEVSGSVVAIKQNLYASRTISDSFALISTTGYPDIPVRYENQPLGKTDSNGYLLIPTVTSYTHGKYEIDPIGLPADVKVPVVEQYRSVKQSSGTVIEFPVSKILPATLTLVDSTGTPLPRGSIIYLNGQDNVSYVGWDGDSYLENIAAENNLVVQRADNRAQCYVHFTLPTPEPTGVITLNTLVCSEEGKP